MELVVIDINQWLCPDCGALINGGERFKVCRDCGGVFEVCIDETTPALVKVNLDSGNHAMSPEIVAL